MPIKDQSKADSIAWYLDGQFQTSNKPTFTIKKQGLATIKQVAFDQTTGNTDTASATIYGFDKPSPSLKPASICGNKPDTLKADSGFNTYQWQFKQQSVPVTTRKSSVYGNGVYEVLVRDSNGCVGVDSSKVNARVNLRSDTSICPGDSIQLHAGNPNATYKWQNGSKGQTLKVSEADTFYVEVSANSSCRGYDTVVIGDRNKPSIPLQSDTSICPKDSLTLDATTLGVDSYRWENGIEQPVLAVKSSDTFSITVIDTNGCRSTDSVIVNEHPVPAININDQSFCAGDSIILDPGKAVNYSWRNGDTTRTTVVKYSGLQVVTAKNGFNCTAQDSAFITQKALPQVNLRTDTSICPEDTLTLDAGPHNRSYRWSTGDTTAIIPVIEKGLYTVSVTNRSCTAKDSFRLRVYSPLDFSLGMDTTLCPSDSIVLNGPPSARSYQWSNGQRTDSLLVGDSLRIFPNPERIGLTIRDTNGCRSSDSLTITLAQKPDFTVNPQDTTICKDDEVTLKAEASTGSYTYTWSDGSSGNTLQFNTATTDTFSITVKATNSQRCLATDTARIIVEGCTGIRGPKAGSVRLYPNPAGERTQLVWNPAQLKIKQVQVKALNGKRLYQNINPKPTLQLPSSQWSAGTYIITIKTQQFRFSRKLIIQ